MTRRRPTAKPPARPKAWGPTDRQLQADAATPEPAPSSEAMRALHECEGLDRRLRAIEEENEELRRRLAALERRADLGADIVGGYVSSQARRPYRRRPGLGL